MSTIQVPTRPPRWLRDLPGLLRHRRMLAMLRRTRRRAAPPTMEAILKGRREFDEVGEFMGAPVGAVLNDDDADGVPVQWVDRRSAPADPLGGPGPVVFYVHGGAYAMGSIQASRHAADVHLRRARALGLVVEYRLAPEHPYPAGLDDVERAWHWLVRRHDPRDVVALGESAGGGLLMSLLCRLRDQGAPMPAGAVTVSAWANLAMDTASYRDRRERDLALDTRLLAHAASAYLGDGADPNDPEVSPVWADLRGLPPLLLAVGTEEVVWDDTTTLHQQALDAGVDAKLLVGRGQIHCFPGYADHVPAASEAVDHIAAFIHEQVRQPRPA